jgi:eukaryotic-like serine/threonine-protein kinase
MDLRPGTTVDGPDGAPITIDSFLGAGGMGQVLGGRLPDGTRVAVKTVLTAALSGPELQALQNEAGLAREVQHPNVVRVLHVDDGSTVPGRPPYVVMEFVEGGSLQGLIDERRAKASPFTTAELRALFAEIAAGMAAVNAKVVHRDLKPANILVDRGGQLRIADFGLAKLAGAATRTLTFKGGGTIPYMAPEAFDATANTPAMDVYSAGVVFYELAAFTWPVQPKAGDQRIAAWARAHLLEPPTDLRTLRKDAPADLVQLMTQMLEKNPARRPTWAAIVERVAGPTAPAAGGPDVAALVQKATTRFQEATAAILRAKEEQERKAERTALLGQAFLEPLEQLRGVVEAFNGASALGRLALQKTDGLRAVVRSSDGVRTLTVSGGVVPDLPVAGVGIVRMIGAVQISPRPTFGSTNAYVQGYPESFEGFNLVYAVQQPEDRFGDWTQFRFEINPIISQRRDIRWHAIALGDLSEALATLRGMGMYQHETRPLDEQWFTALLAQVV